MPENRWSGTAVYEPYEDKRSHQIHRHGHPDYGKGKEDEQPEALAASLFLMGKEVVHGFPADQEKETRGAVLSAASISSRVAGVNLKAPAMSTPGKTSQAVL